MPDDIRSIISVLTWRQPEPGLIAALQDQYLSAGCHALGSKLARLRVHYPELSKFAEERLASLSNHALANFLRRPLTARHLISEIEELERVGRYLASPADSERTYEVGRLLGSIPIKANYVDQRTAQKLASRVTALADETVRLCEPLAEFWPRCMVELQLREDHSRANFFSNSPQAFVGRAMITNGHLSFVDDVMLIEAMVHEATHGFVGLSESVGLSGIEGGEPWLLDTQPYDGISRVVSPWTGTPLDLPTYLHACFVWWGLLHFWGEMQPHPFCNRGRRRSRFFRALGGFRNNAFAEEVRPYSDIIAPRLLAGLADMAASLEPLWAVNHTEAAA
jgi:hypothetical protein